jgi:hypothetical protein
MPLITPTSLRWRGRRSAAIDTYFAPNKIFPNFRELMNGYATNPLRAFSEECRAEPRALNDR